MTTNDDDLAKRLRNIRSSYGAGPPVQVVKTSNGRMSEAQAAIGLLSLDNFSNIVARNEELFGLYRKGLADIDGLRLVAPVNVSRSNFQFAVVAGGRSRIWIVSRSASEGFESREHHSAEIFLSWRASVSSLGRSKSRSDAAEYRPSVPNAHSASDRRACFER